MAQVIETLLDSSHWDWLNKNSSNVPQAIKTDGKFSIFGTPNGPTGTHSNEVANQFSATSDYQMAIIRIMLVPTARYSDTSVATGIDEFQADLQSFLKHAWLRLLLNKSEVFIESVAKLINYPFTAISVNNTDCVGTGGGSVGSLVGKRALGSQAPVVFPGGQTFQFDLIVDQGYSTADAEGGFFVQVGTDGYQLLRDSAASGF